MITKLGVSDIWREHVIYAVNWAELKKEYLWDKKFSLAIQLDLFFGGTLTHEIIENGFLCRNCFFVKDDGGLSSACQCHLGVIEAFMKGLAEEGTKSEKNIPKRNIIDKKCVIEI